MGSVYTQVEDYLLPTLALPEEDKSLSVFWGKASAGGTQIAKQPSRQARPAAHDT